MFTVARGCTMTIYAASPRHERKAPPRGEYDEKSRKGQCRNTFDAPHCRRLRLSSPKYEKSRGAVGQPLCGKPSLKLRRKGRDARRGNGGKREEGRGEPWAFESPPGRGSGCSFARSAIARARARLLDQRSPAVHRANVVPAHTSLAKNKKDYEDDRKERKYC